MSNKVAERLLILKEHGGALLERLYNIRQRMKYADNRPMAFAEDAPTQKLLTKLQKDYPKESFEVENVQGYDYVKQNLTKMYEQMQGIFSAFRETIEWTQHAQKTLEEMCTSANVELKFDFNYLLVMDFFSVMVCFAKIALMINRIDERKLLISFYNLTYAKINGQPDPFVPRVVQYFNDFEKPWSKLQEIFFTIQNHVGRALLEIWTAYEKGEFNYLSNKRPLELLFEPDRIPFPSIEPVYFDLAQMDKYNEFILYGYLCCPEGTGMTPIDPKKGPTPAPAANSKEPQGKRGLDLLFKAVHYNYIVSIYGDETFLLQEPLDALFAKFKSSSISLKKEAKGLKAAIETAANTAQETHKEIRQYLRLQLKNLLNMVRDNPGLLAPKFQLVLATLSMAKSEVMWYLRHADVQSKKIKYKDVVEHNIGELLYLIDTVSRLCLQHRDIISTYYRDMVAKLFTRKVKDIYAQVELRLEGQNAQLLEAIFSNLENPAQFEAFRLNWKRLNATLSGFQFKNFLKDKHIEAMSAQLNRVFALTRHVDDLDREMLEYSSLRELYFYQPQMQKIFSTNLTAKQTQPLYAMAFVRALQHYPDNINKSLNPELRGRVGREAVRFAQEMLNEVAAVVENCVRDLGKDGFQLLSHQVGGDKVVNRLKSKSLKLKEPPIPGFESQYANRFSIDKMKTTEKIVTQLLFSVNTYEEVLVYDTVFYPAEFVRDRLEALAAETVAALLAKKEQQHAKDQKPPQFLQPSVILSELRTFMNTLKFVEQCIQVNTDEIVAGVLLDQLVHWDNVETPYDAVNSEKPNFIKTCAQWYIDLVANHDKFKLLYNPLRKTLVNTKETPILSYRVEDFLDTNELAALVELTGAYGVRTMDQEIYAQMQTTLEKLREVLSNNLSIMKEVESALYMDGIIEGVLKKTKALDTLIPLFIRLGALLVFRKTLHEVLEQVTKRTIPVIHSTVKSVIAQYPQALLQKDDKSLIIDALAHDCGIAVSETLCDNALKKKIAPYADTSSAWEVVGTSFAVMLMTAPIAQCTFDPAYEGWSNNLHLAVPAFHALIQGATCSKAKDLKTVEKEYDRFAEVAAQVLLNMKTTKNLQTAHILVDKISKTTPFAKMNVFDEFNPYPLTRSHYIAAYESWTASLEKTALAQAKKATPASPADPTE